MIQNFLSRYHPRYVRSLVYMLQACEYHIPEYLSWLNRTKNFQRVENRKKLVFTLKASIFLVIGYLLLLFSLIGGVYLALSLHYFGFLIWLIIFPWFIAYAITVPVFLFNTFIQKSLEYFILKKTKSILAKHQGIKIAIAGSYGKTTMREILKTVLSQGKKTVAPPQSYNTPLGVAKFVKELAGDEEVLIFELGEYYSGDVNKLCQVIMPDRGIITGVNEAHLEKFKTLEKTRETIFELAAFTADEKLYLNSENEYTRQKALPENKLYSREGIGEWKVSKKRTGLEGTWFTAEKEGRSLELHSNLLGLHQIGPLLVAMEIALSMGFSEAQMKAGIQETKPFAHRLEIKKGPNNATILDDSYNGNPDGVKAVVEFLASLAGHKRWYVTPGLVEMGERTQEIHREIGYQLARSGIENVALMRNSVTPYVEEGLRQGGYAKEIIWFENMPEFLETLSHRVLEHDVVLIQNDWPDQYI